MKQLRNRLHHVRSVILPDTGLMLRMILRRDVLAKGLDLDVLDVLGLLSCAREPARAQKPDTDELALVVVGCDDDTSTAEEVDELTFARIPGSPAVLEVSPKIEKELPGRILRLGERTVLKIRHHEPSP